MINKKHIIILIISIIIFTILTANSRVAFSRPSSVLRTPSSSMDDADENSPLFTVGFSTEMVNFKLPTGHVGGGSTGLYLQTKTSNGFHLGLTYTTLSDPRTYNEIEADTEKTYPTSSEIGLHIQKRVYTAGNIAVDIGIHDIMARNRGESNSEFQSPSIFTVFSSKKEFEKYSILFNYGFGSGKVGKDIQVSDFDNKDKSEIKPYLGFKLITPELKRIKNSVNLLFEYDGTGVSLGAKIPITNEYIISLGVIHFNNMGDFGLRSKAGEENKDLPVLEDAATVCFGFEMNVPRIQNKDVMIDNPYANQSNISPDKNIIYTSSAVEELKDSLHRVIDQTISTYEAVADSVRFLQFSLENSNIENTSLEQKITKLENKVSQNETQKIIDIKNFNKATRYISRSLRYYYENEFNKALIEIDKAIEINPNLAIAYARKGTIYYRIGQTQNASINWNIALKLDPEYDEVRDILEALKTDNLKSVDLEEDKE